MAKRFALIVLLLFPLIPISPAAAHGYAFDVRTDLMALDFLWQDGARFSLDAGWRIKDMRFSVPVTYAWNLHSDISFLDIALRVDCYPFDGWGLFFGVDALRYGRWFGIGAPEKRNVFPSSLSMGWTFSWPFFVMEPRITVTDPARISEIELEPLRKNFLMYGSVYVQLNMGIAF